MKILLTGSSGLIGQSLSTFLRSQGNEVVCLSRGRNDSGAYWCPEENEISISRKHSIDAVIHLAGESIAGGRWTGRKKKLVLDSRVDGTKLLSDYFSKLDVKPKVFISGSAIGYYGDCGDEVVDENCPVGDQFLSDVCQQWEDATSSMRDVGIRVVNARLGIVLSLQGGALKKMLLPFKLGLGGIVGSGRQYMSWILLDDVTRMLNFILREDSLTGPVNVVSPFPVRNADFTRLLGIALRRIAIFPIPSFIVKIVFGQMGDELLLSSIRASSNKVSSYGYRFFKPKLNKALKWLMQNKA